MKVRGFDNARRGLTLIELVLALGLLMLLMIAVFQLFDRALSVWRRGETRRNLLEQASVVCDLFAGDLRGLDGGARSDCLAEWVRFDTDGDGVFETKWPRLRFVRQASAADVARIPGEAKVAPELAQKKLAREPDEPASATLERALPGLIEIVWLVAPASFQDKDARGEGVVWRGERLVGDGATKSFFAPDFFGTSNRPPAGATEEVTGGLLWMQLLFATQTSIVHDGWKLSKDLDSAATSWDAWSRDRPDAAAHPWNEKAAGMPKVRDLPLLPRRVRLELEFERPSDRVRRTRLTQVLETQDSNLRVDDVERVPHESDIYILIDAEWMRVGAIDGRSISVERAQRGTAATNHAAGALVHHGQRLVREVAIAMYREDWDL